MWTRETIDERIDELAEEYEVSAKTMKHIVSRESRYHPFALGDMNITCKRTGKPVRARGLSQITECYYPEVSDEQAFDPEFALTFLAKHLAAGECRKWSTCPI